MAKKTDNTKGNEPDLPEEPATKHAEAAMKEKRLVKLLWTGVAAGLGLHVYLWSDVWWPPIERRLLAYKYDQSIEEMDAESLDDIIGRFHFSHMDDKSIEYSISYVRRKNVDPNWRAGFTDYEYSMDRDYGTLGPAHKLLPAHTPEGIQMLLDNKTFQRFTAYFPDRPSTNMIIFEKGLLEYYGSKWKPVAYVKTDKSGAADFIYRIHPYDMKTIALVDPSSQHYKILESKK